jgi:hypothetical protein
VARARAARLWWLPALILAAGVVGGVIFLVYGGRADHEAAPGSSSPSPGRLGLSLPSGNHSFSNAGPAQLIPRSGASLGAYVQPRAVASGQALALIEAVRSFESTLGHRLGIVHVYHPWGSTFPSVADRYFASTGSTLLITWGGTPDFRAIVAGRYDAMIRTRARAVKSLGRPVLLEFRHEMDRPNLQWAIHSPTDYIAAWKHIRSIFAAMGATRVGWVWCPTAQGFADGRAQAYYPGDGEVNWICVDAYSASPRQPLGTVISPFLRWAAHRPKPVLIGEFGVHGDPKGWPGWLTGIGRLAQEDTQIKALAYFDAAGRDSQGRPFDFLLRGHAAATSTFASLLAERYFRIRFIQPGDGQ